MADSQRDRAKKQDNKSHRFHGHKDDDRWRALAVFLEALANRIEENDLHARKQLATLTRKMGAIVASLQEVKDELQALKDSTTAEHEQFTAAAQKLADKIAELEAIIAGGSGGATAAELDDLLTGLKEVHAQVSAIVPDEPTT